MSCETQQNDHAPQQTIQQKHFLDLRMRVLLQLRTTKTTYHENYKIKWRQFVSQVTLQIQRLHCKKTFDPRQLKRHVFETKDVVLEESALFHVIQSYTREAGMRELECKLEALCRSVCLKILETGEFSVSFVFLRGNPHKICLAGETKTRHINKSFVENVLGPPIPEEDLKK